MNKTPLIIGTAGHVDHGKTALIRQLTGIDTDRLKEEKQRKLTIDLGFAFLNQRIAFIDVPGHENFIENMVAGASTIDFALMVIAANDSVMPQTREHLKIMQALGIHQGAVVITKIDLVDEEWLQMVKQEVQEILQNTFFDNGPIFTVSSQTGEGIQNLREFLSNLEVKKRLDGSRELFRLPVDRVFTVHGFGTVVTGTVISGTVESSQKVQKYPGNKICEVRTLQKHKKEAQRAIKSERAALNISDIEKNEIQRGDFLGTPQKFISSNLITTRVYLFPDSQILEYYARIKVNIGTGKYVGRIRFIGKDELESGQNCIAQIDLNEEISAGFRDKFVIRSLSPATTIGGGEILKIGGARIRKKETDQAQLFLKLYSSDTKESIKWFITNSKKGIDINQLTIKSSMSRKQLEPFLDEMISERKIVEIGNKFYSCEKLQNVKDQILEFIEKYHRENSLEAGVNYNKLSNELNIEIEILEYLLKNLQEQNKVKKLSNHEFALQDFTVELSTQEQKIIKKLYRQIMEAGKEPIEISQLGKQFDRPIYKLNALIKYLCCQNKAIILQDNLVISNKALNECQQEIGSYLADNEKARVSEIRDLLGTSRKYTIPILNHLDNIGFTLREGKYRYLRR
ncbi:MAG TPA: selenocysteine-specific translation elongation factor [bacterium]|nr:selenocysteine-specific translation elongation factor [bacterium]